MNKKDFEKADAIEEIRCGECNDIIFSCDMCGEEFCDEEYVYCKKGLKEHLHICSNCYNEVGE